MMIMRRREGGSRVEENLSKRQNKNNPTSNPEPQSPSRQTPAVQQLGLDSSLPLVHRSWSFKNQLYSSTSNLPVKTICYALRNLSTFEIPVTGTNVNRQERWLKTNKQTSCTMLLNYRMETLKSKHKNAFSVTVFLTIKPLIS